MLDSTLPIPPTDWLRLSIVYVHLLLCAFALVQVLHADTRIATGRFTIDELRRTANRTAAVLGALWASGLTIIYLDTSLDPAVLATNSKLLLKLVTVLVLTVNGVLLHFLSFPIIASWIQPTLRQAMLLAVTGALSTSHWLLAAFVGMAGPLGRWPFDLLLSGYAAYVTATILVALASVPTLRRKLTPPESRDGDMTDRLGQDELDVLLLPSVWAPEPKRSFMTS